MKALQHVDKCMRIVTIGSGSIPPGAYSYGDHQAFLAEMSVKTSDMSGVTLPS